MLFIAFEGMGVATAMPVAVRELDGLSWYAWSFSGFLITSLVGMVVAGDICDRRGPRLPFILCALIFGAGLLIAGSATTMSVFVLGRAVQGFGVGLGIVAIYIVVGRAYPADVRPRAFAVMSSAWVLPAILGPAAAGWLVESASWRVVFLGVLPLTIPGVLMVLPTLRAQDGPSDPEAVPRPARTVPAALAAVGVAALQYAGQRAAVASLLPLAVGGLLLWRTLPRLLPAGTLRAARGLPTTVLMRGVLASSYFGAEAFVPLMLVQERGLRPGTAGLVLTGGALGWATGSWWQGRPATRTPRHRLVQAGCALVTVAVAAVAVTAATSVTPLLAAVGWTIGGAGMGLGMASLGILVLEQSPPADQGANASSLQLSDALLSTVAVGIAGGLFAALHVGAGRDAVAYLWIDAVMLMIAVFGVVIGGRIRSSA